MIVFPNAKINLGLNITQKRADGYHNIETIFIPINWCDVLEVIENKGVGENVELAITGLPVAGNLNDNLIVKAYNLLKADYVLPKVKVHLHKIIPMGAGLGGGSADAAFFLKVMNDLFGLNIAIDKLKNYAAKLGSDCAFFIENKPLFAHGKGDEFKTVNIDLGDFTVVVVYPNVHVSTALAYSKVKPAQPNFDLIAAVVEPVNSWPEKVKNDFEVSVFEEFPIIRDIKQNLYAAGAVYAAMSGSGSAVFGLFEKSIDAKQKFPSYLVWQDKLSKHDRAK
jgi:4-diphosphocytidyl-2-C-methyl-D-erythritol kinase